MKKKYYCVDFTDLITIFMDIENFLIELRKYWLENDIPNISQTNTKFLRDLIKIQKTKNMLEIGTANWFSAINFWIELEKNNWKLITIDFSPNSHKDAVENIEKAWLEKVITPILWNALDEIPKLDDNYFDFVFIDWMKRRSKDFLELVFPKTKKNWIIVIDDVIKFKEKMPNLEEYLQKEKIGYNILPIDWDDGILMIVR